MDKVLKFVVLLLVTLFTLTLYIWVAFIVGWEYLTSIQGSDTLVYLSHLKTLADYFPNYPFWNHLEGGGVSLTASYPILTHTALIVISRITHLNLVETLKLVGFLSVPLFSLGIYFFALTRTKNILISFLAGLFYVISPIAWIFLFEWGFYAESVASILFAPTIIFFCAFLDKPKRIYVVFSSIFLALSLLAHGTIATAAATFMVLYALSLSFFQKDRLKTLLGYGKALVITILLGILLAGFWFFPFYKYSKIADSGGNLGGQVRVDEYKRNKINTLEVLSFKPELDKFVPAYNFRNILSTLFILGSILVFFSKKKDQLAFNITTLLLLYASIDVWVTIVMKFIPILGVFASWRSFIYVPRVGIPIIAASSVYFLFYYSLTLIKKYVQVRHVLATIFGFIATLSILWIYKDQASYGKEVTLTSRKLDYRDVWKMRMDDPCIVESIAGSYPHCRSKLFTSTFNIPEFLQLCEEQKNQTGICTGSFSDAEVVNLVENCSTFCAAKYDSLKNQLFAKDYYTARLSEFRQDLDFKSGPKHIYKNGKIVEKKPSETDEIFDYRGFFAKIPDDIFARYDLSVGAVEFSKVSPYFKNTTPALPVYINTAWLINRFWGYQLSNFYADDPVYPDHSTLLDIAKWYGIKHIVFGGNQDTALPRYEREGFTRIDEQPILALDNPETNIAINNKPKILVIGNTSNPVVYDEVFKKSNLGIIAYDSAMLIKGTENVDDYTINELKSYDLIFLYGYKYERKEKAWELLDNYLNGGGSIFIDTGWQYVSKDWQIGKTAEFFPTENLTWTNFGKVDDFQVNSDLFDNSDVDTAGIEPLIWNDLPWGVSSGELRQWAKPILSVSDGTLVAGGYYGQGKIVWSGMNTLGHIKNYESENPEVSLMENIILWLLGEGNITNLQIGTDFNVLMNNPDKVEVILNKPIADGYGLYFKESYFPYWKVNNNLIIEYAGPGFMYVDLSEMGEGDKLIFSMAVMPEQIIGYIASLGGVIASVLYLLGLLKFKFLERIKFKGISLDSRNEDIDY
ncbi:MAG: hypothetical protein UT61_C0065G0004 [Candidatus Woesebacteria bacterium GW2011_GWA1_39_8]|uniref:Membrane protein 6-pyruvoyl-tetrahydropterin synthase-related domain-containing protein n=1 Tax=Candidatus Woesebacteria bacterium GW2011_GWA1_39_8 TaxID=1618552 RepID=A0A0G0RZH2_9BACT|nr:MAG: hypothetical protein UT61_C0065G0004 [Candidatus Woesebacteria bacterium GW2011_GWA1_39_8]